MIPLLCLVHGMESIRSGLADPALGERRRGSEGHHPLGRRPALIPDGEGQRTVWVRELHAGHGAVKLFFPFHIVHASQGVMGLQQAGGHADVATNPKICLIISM
jgi:hypothetical protein